MKRSSFLVVVFFVLAGRAYAQDSQVFGRATDSSGAVLPGVTVTLSSPVLLEPRVAVTSETGTYQFPGLPIGVYSVKFELAGFTPVVRKGLQLEGSFNAQVNADLSVADLQEDVVVTAVSPIVDVRSTTQGERFSAEELKVIPSARDVFHVLNQTPGIAIDRQNVGGNINGQATGMFSRGAGNHQGRWFVDGVDRVGGGGAPFTLDFNAVEEVQISTGGADVTMQTPGVLVNIVNKGGSDVYRGSAWTFISDRAFGSDNVSEELRRLGGLGDTPIATRDFGGQFGGPIKRGRAWFWGSHGRQRTKLGIPNYYKQTAECAPVAADPLGYSYAEVVDCLSPKYLNFPSLASKLNLRPAKGNLLTVSNTFGQRVESAYGSSDLVSQEATSTLTFTRRRDSALDLGLPLWNTEIWDPSWKFADQQSIGDRWLVDLFFAHHCFCNTKRPPDSTLGLQPMLELSTGHRARRASSGEVQQITNNDVSLTSTYFLPGRWGGDHSLKGGYRHHRKRSLNDTTGLGFDVQAVFNSPRPLPPFSTPFTARLVPASTRDRFLYQHSTYFQDTYTDKRLTLNLGVRWDRQDDEVPPVNQAAHPFQGQITLDGTPFGLLPAIDVPAVSSGVVWNTVVPRLGVTYDLTGDARNVLKASYAVYFDQRTAGYLASPLNPVSSASVDLGWTDRNGDTVVQANEVDTRIIRSVSGFDPANPAARVTSNQVDPTITAPRTDEIVVGFGTEMKGDFGISLSYVWRKYGNFIWEDRVGISSADYSPVTFTPPASACPAGARCETVTYYVPNFRLPSTYILMNRPDYRRIYNGVEFVVRKRFSGGWLLNGSYSYNSTIDYYDSPAAYEDPTNISLLNGAQFAPTTGIGGGGGNPLSSVPVNAKWIARLNGSYLVLRIGVNLAVAADVRQGYPFIQAINVASRPNQAGGVAVQLDPPGDIRFPTFKNVDFHVDRAFRVWGATISPAFDVFNLFNADTVMARRTNQNAANANQIYGILQGRTGRVGLMVTF